MSSFDHFILSILILRGCILKRTRHCKSKRYTDLSILILRGCILKQNWKRPSWYNAELSILILRGCILKRWRWRAELPELNAFNPHFARMHLETKASRDRAPLQKDFQSSFCEDASWNRNSDRILQTRSITFNPHFARMHLETSRWKKFSAALKNFQSSFCEDASWNLSSSWYVTFNTIFQSSFCEDASWNSTISYHSRLCMGLSILILRGCILKPSCPLTSPSLNTPFNPHFARMHLETLHQIYQ